jgi:hypothetical protein
MYIAFAGSSRIAFGDLEHVVRLAKPVFDSDKWAQILVFDSETSQQMGVNWSGTVDDVLWRLETAALAAQPARRVPKPGVVARQVALLPRHWEWLAGQPGGASVALRKLVEQARGANQGKDRQRRAQDAAYRFITAMAGNEPGYEEACRALFANRREDFFDCAAQWPLDIREHACKLADVAFETIVPRA